MKIKGKTLDAKRTEEVYIPRGENGEDGFVFTVQSVASFDRFDELVKEPAAPMIHRPGKAPEANVKDKGYQSALEDYNKKRMGYLVIESLKATEDLEWETIKEDEPDTWGNYLEELGSSGLLPMEVGTLVRAILNVNSLDEEAIEAARERFLALRRQAQNDQ